MYQYAWTAGVALFSASNSNIFSNKYERVDRKISSYLLLIKYRGTIFGHVVSGQDVVNAIRRDDIIEKIEIIRKGDKANNFATDQAAFDKLLAQRK